MKKLTLTIGCALAVAGAAFAQGTVHWDTISAAGYTAQTNSTQVSPLFGGAATGSGTIGNTANSTITPNGYFWELLYLGGASASTPTSLVGLNAWSDTGLSAVQTASAGRTTPLGPQATTAATVPWANGTSDNIMLVGWSANLGSTWANVLATLNGPAAALPLNAYFGMSTTGYIDPNAGNPGAVIVGGGPNANGTPIQSTLTPLYVVNVPEPATLALAGLSGLSLLLFRRQRK